MKTFTIEITDEEWNYFQRFWLNEVSFKYPNREPYEYFGEELIDNARDCLSQLMRKKLDFNNRPLEELVAMWDGFEQYDNLRRQAQEEE